MSRRVRFVGYSLLVVGAVGTAIAYWSMLSSDRYFQRWEVTLGAASIYVIAWGGTLLLPDRWIKQGLVYMAMVTLAFVVFVTLVASRIPTA